MRSEGFTSTSWESSPGQRVRKVGNFLRQVALSGYWSKYSNRSTGASWTPLAVPGACLFKAHGLWRSINETVILRKVLVPQPPKFLSTVRRRRVKLCRMNLAIHGLEGDVRETNTYYEDLHQSTGQFDFLLANPPFNVNAVDKERLTGDVGKNRRFPFGLPRTDNANYLWIQLFYSALNDKGRAGFIMANSASDARSSEQELRRQLIENRGVDVVVAVGPNFFYTVTLPCTLWFFDRGKEHPACRHDSLPRCTTHLPAD